jgi:hypothetical protein
MGYAARYRWIHWKPLHPEAIEKRSQDLPRTCTDAGLFHFMKWKEVANYKTLNVYEKIFFTSKKAIDSTKFNTFLECSLVENVFTRP